MQFKTTLINLIWGHIEAFICRGRSYEIVLLHGLKINPRENKVVVNTERVFADENGRALPGLREYYFNEHENHSQLDGHQLYEDGRFLELD